MPVNIDQALRRAEESRARAMDCEEGAIDAEDSQAETACYTESIYHMQRAIYDQNQALIQLIRNLHPRA